MADHSIGFIEHRRANRIAWNRPVWITQPAQIPGRSVNVSACGLLVRLRRGYPLRMGEPLDVEIPRADGMAVLARRGRVARIELRSGEMWVGVELV
jgi:hypothetical protein